MKVTNKIKKEIIELRNRGLKIKEIANKFNLSTATIIYHINEESRINKIENQKQNFKNLSIEKQKEAREKQRDYQKKYHNKKYKEDEEFREKQKRRARDYAKRKYWENKNSIELKGGKK